MHSNVCGPMPINSIILLVERGTLLPLSMTTQDSTRSTSWEAKQRSMTSSRSLSYMRLMSMVFIRTSRLDNSRECVSRFESYLWSQEASSWTLCTLLTCSKQSCRKNQSNFDGVSMCYDGSIRITGELLGRSNCYHHLHEESFSYKSPKESNTVWEMVWEDAWS